MPKHFFPMNDYLGIIKDLLTPKEIRSSVTEIPLESLYQDGYHTMLIDVDNTILAASQRTLSLEHAHWVEKAKEIGFDVLLVSNNSSYRRIKRVCEHTKTTGIYFALKPFVFSIKDLAKRHGITLSQCLVVGDQMLTDVLIGNWIGAYPILVDPIDKKLSFIKTLQRELELFLLSKIS